MLMTPPSLKLNVSTHYRKRPTQQHLEETRGVAIARLNSDLSIISDWGTENLLDFNATKTQFLHLSTRHDLPNGYSPLFNNTQLNPSSSLNILGVSFSRDLSWKDHISSLTKSSSMKLAMLYRLKNFFTPEQLLSLYRGHIRPCMEYASHIWGGSSHVSLLDKMEKKAFRLINLPKLTDEGGVAQW